MRKHLLGISAIALMSATSFAIAQDRPGAGGGAGGGASPPSSAGPQSPGGGDGGLSGSALRGGGEGPGRESGPGPAASPRGEPSMRGAEERSGGGPKEKSASDKSLGDKGPAEKSAADERRGKNDKQAGDHKRDDKMQRSEGERGDRGKDSSATGAGSGESGSADRSTSSSSSKTSVHLSNEQRTKVQTVFRGHKSASVNVNIDARVGVAVPRSVTLVAVPEDIVVLVPEWRRYRYIVIGDTVCIVDPDTYEIIDVIVVS